MKAVSRSRHFLAVLIFAAAASTYWYVALHDDRISNAQVHYATAAVKAEDPSAMSGDSVFGDGNLWRLNLPAPQWVLSSILRQTSHEDMILPFRIVAGIVSMIYLCGMYALLLNRCGSWSVAMFVSLMSSRVVAALGRSFWGVGSLGSITPEGLVVALTPWAVLAFVRLEKRRILAMAFLGIGLLANIHPVGAANLTAVLLLVHVMRKPLAGGRWLSAAACLVCAALGAMPAAWQYVQLRMSFDAGAGLAGPTAALEALRLGRLGVLYSEIPGAALRWLGTLAVLLVAAAAVSIRPGSVRVKSRTLWIAMVAAVFVVSLGMHALCLLAGVLLNAPPPAIDFLRASSLLMLPLYIFFADALTALFGAARAYRGLLRGACVVVLAVWLILSDNLRPLRHQILEAGTVFLAEADKPRSIQRHQDRRRAHQELDAIAQWARHKSAPRAVFLSDSIRLRMRSRRAIVASADDIRYIYYLTPDRLDPWSKRVGAQRRLLAGTPDAAEVRQFIADLNAQNLFTDADEWYIVAPAGPAAASDLHEITDQRWGSAYRLFRLP